MTRAKTPPPPRAEILAEASALTCGLRNAEYGSPFRNMRNIADLWQAYLSAKYQRSITLEAADVARMNQLQKMARTFESPTHRDSFVDDSAYAAIAYEVAVEEAK